MRISHFSLMLFACYNLSR